MSDSDYSLCKCEIQAELEAARKFLYQEMGYRSRSEQLTKTSEINLDYQEVVRYLAPSSLFHILVWRSFQRGSFSRFL